LSGTVFEKTRQGPATLVLLLRGIAKGEFTARLARKWGLSRTQLYTLRQRLQAKLNETASNDVLCGTAFEADELYYPAGEKAHVILTLQFSPGGALISGKGPAPKPASARLSPVRSASDADQLVRY
jgi:hypothetical protein